MMLIRIIIMLLIALFVESRQEAFGQTTDTLSLSDGMGQRFHCVPAMPVPKGP